MLESLKANMISFRHLQTDIDSEQKHHIFHCTIDLIAPDSFELIDIDKLESIPITPETAKSLIPKIKDPPVEK